MVTEYAGVLPKIQLEVRQVYERFDASSIAEADCARFDYFCNKVYPKIQDLDEIRGTHHLLIYSLPGRKEYYPELVNMLGESKNPKCNVLFSRLDLLKLERIVGTSSARRYSSDKSMFVFC